MMSVSPRNPYEPPRVKSGAVGVMSGSRADVRKVAQYQKGVIICLLIGLIAPFLLFALLPLGEVTELVAFVMIIIELGILINGLVSMVFVFLLATKVYNGVVGVLLGILALIPCISLIVLVIINGKATSILRKNGIKVGFLGANLSQI